MSIHVSSWAWKQHVGDEGAKLVLLKLADSANDEGIAWPARALLRLETEAIHIDTITRRLRRLRDLELAFPVPWFTMRGGRTSSMYVLPYRGVPSAGELMAGLVAADRVGSPDKEMLAEVAAAEVVGAFFQAFASADPPRRGRLGGLGAGAGDPLGVGAGGALGVGAGAILEPSVDPSVDPGPGGRARDPLWDVLEELFGSVGDGKSNARGKRNAAVRDLRGFDASVESVLGAARAWDRVMPAGALMTDSALATHYPQLAHIGDRAAAPRARASQPPCVECEVGGGRHAEGCPLASAA